MWHVCGTCVARRVWYVCGTCVALACGTYPRPYPISPPSSINLSIITPQIQSRVLNRHANSRPRTVIGASTPHTSTPSIPFKTLTNPCTPIANPRTTTLRSTMRTVGRIRLIRPRRSVRAQSQTAVCSSTPPGETGADTSGTASAVAGTAVGAGCGGGGGEEGEEEEGEEEGHHGVHGWWGGRGGR